MLGRCCFCVAISHFSEMEKDESPCVCRHPNDTNKKEKKVSNNIHYLEKENISIEGTFSDIISPQFHFLFSPQN